MPSQFSSIGFSVTSGEDLAALASRVADRAETIDVASGHYLKWAPASGEQLWLQITRSGDAMGMNPHFEGSSVLPALIEARVSRRGQTPLDGAFLAWANPSADGTPGGDYPFAFDCPDAATCGTLPLPAAVTLQMAAFAQQVTVHASEADYLRDQVRQRTSFDSRSFIPSGLMSPSGEPVTPPESHALIAGHVMMADQRINSVSGQPFWWALLDTRGGTFDVVIDASLLSAPLEIGNVLSGWFWLSGRVRRNDPPRRSTWFQRLTGR